MYAFPKTFVRDKLEEFGDLKQLTEQSKRKYGDKAYFTYKENETVHNISFNQMHGYINSLGTAFYELGIMGKNIALLSETRYEWIVSYLAAVNGNGIIAPIDREVMPDQIISFIERAKASCVIYSEAFAELIEGYAKNGEKKEAKFFINMDLKNGPSRPEHTAHNILSWQSLIDAGRTLIKNKCTAFTDVKIDREKACAYLFTSGTTGTSKAVMLSHKNIASNAYCAACSVDFDSSDTLVAVLPAHHTYETTCSFFATYSLGVNICRNESLKLVLRNFQFYKPTKLVLVPLFIDNMVKKIWDEIDKKGKRKIVKIAIKLSNMLRLVRIDLRRKLFKEVLGAFGGRLELIICGGAPLNPAHVTTLDNFGIKICQGYGTTECAPLISVVPADMHMKKVGSVGHPIFSNEVKIDKKNENGHGEILVRGDNVMLGYLGDEKATREVFTEDGFYKTGDVGYIDSDNCLYITGRKKNVIILNNGKNVYPEEIEEYLQNIAEIKECAVISRSKGGEDNITALIVPDFERFEGKDFGEIEKYITEKAEKINRQLPSYKKITKIEVRREEFEKTASKKIKRNLLN
ncbi:MAG: AMP-binding protein [Oscillospiraceae bacterium]|nr:AMP-binding protein [Oscillospiraceae bacterium]